MGRSRQQLKSIPKRWVIPKCKSKHHSHGILDSFLEGELKGMIQGEDIEKFYVKRYLEWYFGLSKTGLQKVIDRLGLLPKKASGVGSKRKRAEMEDEDDVCVADELAEEEDEDQDGRIEERRRETKNTYRRLRRRWGPKETISCSDVNGEMNNRGWGVCTETTRLDLISQGIEYAAPLEKCPIDEQCRKNRLEFCLKLRRLFPKPPKGSNQPDPLQLFGRRIIWTDEHWVRAVQRKVGSLCERGAIGENVVNPDANNLRFSVEHSKFPTKIFLWGQVRYGYKMGIWVAPQVCTGASRGFAHQDYLHAMHLVLRPFVRLMKQRDPSSPPIFQFDGSRVHGPNPLPAYESIKDSTLAKDKVAKRICGWFQGVRQRLEKPEWNDDTDERKSYYLPGLDKELVNFLEQLPWAWPHTPLTSVA